MDRFINKVFFGNALDLLRALPSSSVNAVITDPMYGVKSPYSVYDWGPDPADNDPQKHWQYHQPISEEARRVLKPDGALAWTAGIKFAEHFTDWFGGHRVWALTRFGRSCIASGHLWIVQTRDQRPIRFPDRDGLVLYKSLQGLRKLHPCPKTVEEVSFLIESLTKPGQIVLDCFCGVGATLLAAEKLGRRWIGCDLSQNYCRVALRRLAELRQGRDCCGTDRNLYRLKPKVEVATPSPCLARQDSSSIVMSSYRCNNAFLLAQVAKLYFRRGDRIADVTYGTGAFWRTIDLSQYDLHPSDLLTVPDHPYDFRKLPYPSESFDVYVLDPPYIKGPGHTWIHNDRYKSYQTTKGFSHSDIIDLYRDGMSEGHRILSSGGLMLVKCKDEIENGRQKMSHIELHDFAVAELEMEVRDLFVLTAKSSMIQFRRPKHARKNHSYLWIFEK